MGKSRDVKARRTTVEVSRQMAAASRIATPVSPAHRQQFEMAHNGIPEHTTGRRDPIYVAGPTDPNIFALTGAPLMIIFD